MKSFMNAMRWIYVGFLLGATAMCYFIAVEEEESKKSNSKYNDPDWIAEKSFGEYSHA